MQIFQRKKLSMYRTPIYIIDHVNFWPPSPRRATKKFEIKCAFLLTQTVCQYCQGHSQNPTKPTKAMSNARYFKMGGWNKPSEIKTVQYMGQSAKGKILAKFCRTNCLSSSIHGGFKWEFLIFKVSKSVKSLLTVPLDYRWRLLSQTLSHGDITGRYDQVRCDENMSGSTCQT